MMALTFWPEWLWVIRYLCKRVENRSWKIPSGVVFKPVLLHAGKRVGGGKVIQGLEWVRDMSIASGHTCTMDGKSLQFADRHFSLEDLIYGAIVGVTAFSSCDQIPGKWCADGQWHWRMMYASFFESPVPCNGAQGLWSVNDQDILRRVMEQISTLRE